MSDHHHVVGDPQSIVLGPSHDESRVWTLTLTTAQGEDVEIELSPRAVDELHNEAKDIPLEHRDTDRLALEKRAEVYGNEDGGE